MSPRTVLVLLGSLAGGLVAACGEPQVTVPDGGGGVLPDAGATPPPDPPALNTIPMRIPYPVATLTGRAAAKRVIVEGSSNPIATPVLPDRTFCVDARLGMPGEYTFRVFAQADDGQVSEPAGPVVVRYDPNAAAIPGAQTCSGGDPRGCTGSMEICGNGRDDDCNNLIDARDPACATCSDDVLEPNDDPAAPRIEPGRYDNLMVCPANSDFYPFSTKEGDQITARIFFVHADGNLDLHLLDARGTGVLGRSVSLDDDEQIVHTSTASGLLRLRVFSDSGAQNRYSLDLRIVPRM